MILTCPECETQYFAEDSTIGDSGRTVKCDACGHSWFVSPAGSAPESATQAHQAYRQKLHLRKVEQTRKVITTVWAAAFGLALAILGGLYLLRQQVVQAWPQSASAYAMLGLQVNRFELDFIDSQAERYFDGTTPILEVRGIVINRADHSVSAPMVRVELISDEGTILDTALASITPSTLPVAAQASFIARIEDPPFEAFELELSFVTEASVQTSETEDAS